jgi:hypothetical protein
MGLSQYKRLLQCTTILQHPSYYKTHGLEIEFHKIEKFGLVTHSRPEKSQVWKKSFDLVSKMSNGRKSLKGVKLKSSNHLTKLPFDTLSIF